MNRLAGAVVATIAFLSALAPAAVRAEEAILAYVQTVRVDAADRLEVVEEITVSAEGNRIRRGIYRDFPTVFFDENDNRRQVGFTVTSVKRNGVDEPWFTSRSANGVRLYIGDEDVLLPTGVYTYTLSYETDRQIRRFDDHDELFWNVTGNDWAFPIERVEATVILPAGVRATQTAAYTGPAGERGADWSVTEEAGGELTFRSTRRLRPGEGLSIVVAMPPGTIAAPTSADQVRYFVRDHRSTLLALVGLIVVLAYYLVAWVRVGRDPPKGTIIPLFEPPNDVSAPLSQYIHERGLPNEGWTALSAAWVALAVKGLVTLASAKDKDLSIEATRAAPPKDLPKSEKTALGWLNGRGGTAVINRAIGPQVQKLNSDFRKAVRTESLETFFHHNRAYSVLGAFLSLCAMVIAAVYSTTMEGDIGSMFPLIFVLVFGALGMHGLTSAWQGRGVATRIGGIVIGAIGMTVAVVGAAGAIGIAISADASPMFPVIGLVLIGINLLFGHLLAAPTVHGRGLMDQIEGLILYMTVAEQPRLNMTGLPPVTPSRYEALLPYAIALDVEKPWTEALQRHLASAAAAGAAIAYSPAWYRGSGFSGGARSFSNSLSTMSRTFQSSVPPPKSSSSGFSSRSGSGGGGGGGGGGGW